MPPFIPYEKLYTRLKTQTAQALVLEAQDAKALDPVFRRNMVDVIIRRNLPTDNLVWLFGPEGQAHGFSLEMDVRSYESDKQAAAKGRLTAPEKIESPLMIAIGLRRILTVQLLLKMGASLNRQPGMVNPLHDLIQRIPDKANVPIKLLDVLKDAGAQFNDPTPLFHTAIRRANHPDFPLNEWRMALGERGAELSGTDVSTGDTNLHVLMQTLNVAVLRNSSLMDALMQELDRGANPCLTNHAGNTPDHGTKHPTLAAMLKSRMEAYTRSTRALAQAPEARPAKRGRLRA